MISLNPYTIIGAISVTVIVFLAGVYQGWDHEHTKFMEFKTETAKIAERQNTKNEYIVKQSELVNKGIKNEYEARIMAIRNHYSNGVRNPSGSAVPTIPNTPFSIDGKASNLELTCAYTTQQLVSLQDWVNSQVSIK